MILPYLAPCALDIPVTRNILYNFQIITGYPEMCNLWCESPVRISSATNLIAKPWRRDIRFRVVRSHTRANKFDTGRPITLTDIRELLRTRWNAHILIK